MKMNNSLVGKRIGQLRKRRGLSQLMLSEMIDRSPRNLCPNCKCLECKCR